MNQSSSLALEFINVTKSFTTGNATVKNVVDDLSITVKQGEFFSILGPSGCGKTTCLRMISGLEKPSIGTIRMQGKVVNDIHPHKRNVHMVFQKYALFPHLNVFDNVAFGLRMKKKSEKEVKDRVTRMLKMVRLDDYTNRMIQQLSGGEQQRVALVRSLVNEPAILLLDEPLGALDLKLREQMQLELSTIQKQLGTTFVFVTHDQWEALTLSHRIAIMNNGKIEQVGTPSEVYESPNTAFVAKFVGTTNIFKGKVISSTPGNISIESPEYGMLNIKPQEGKSLPETGRVVGLVVRPEKIRLRMTAPTQPSAGTTTSVSAAPGGGTQIQTEPTPMVNAHTTNVLRTTILDRTYFGATTQIRVAVQGNPTPIIVLVANQTATKMPSLKAGERYYAVWDANDSILVEDV